MDVVAGKDGGFFVTNGKIDTNTARKLAAISFDEFERYRAWRTLKKISKINDEDYAGQNFLDIDILRKFDAFVEGVDFKATQDLMYFIETENGRSSLKNEDNICRICPANFKNGFLNSTPPEVPGVITDSFSLSDKDVPQMLKSMGIAITRSVVSHFIKWNDVTYVVDVIPASLDARKAAFNNKEIVVGENCYVFQSDDWRYIKKIEQKYNQEKIRCQKSWFKKDKPEDEIFKDVLADVFKDQKRRTIYRAMYLKYVELCKLHTDYRSVFVHEFHHFRNKILVENYCLKPNTKTLQAQDVYRILVEDERSSHLAVTIDHINRYWFNRNWSKLLAEEPCLSILNQRSEVERNRLLGNLDFVTNAKLKYWTDNFLDQHYCRILSRLPVFLNHCSVAKGIDDNRTTYQRLRSMLYSYRVYNPITQSYKLVRTDKYIKIDIPFSQMALENIIGKTKNRINRRLSSLDMLMAKYGLSEKLVRKAANIYDSSLRITKA